MVSLLNSCTLLAKIAVQHSGSLILNNEELIVHTVGISWSWKNSLKEHEMLACTPHFGLKMLPLELDY